MFQDRRKFFSAT